MVQRTTGSYRRPPYLVVDSGNIALEVAQFLGDLVDEPLVAVLRLVELLSGAAEQVLCAPPLPLRVGQRALVLCDAELRRLVADGTGSQRAAHLSQSHTNYLTQLS